MLGLEIPARDLEEARLSQLDQLMERFPDHQPTIVHGSIGHAALMGEELPPIVKGTMAIRDVDVFNKDYDKPGLEELLAEDGLAQPSPVDAGLCGLLIHDRGDYYVQKDCISVRLEDADIFEEVVGYEVKGTDGLVIKGMSPKGMLAVHLLEPSITRPLHYFPERRLMAWFADHNVQLPKRLEQSIELFHMEYEEQFPNWQLYKALASVYAKLVPETARKLVRRPMHKFMYDHTGRKSPYIND